MDVLNEHLSRVRGHCVNLQAHKHVGNQLSLRATQAVVYADELQEDDVQTYAERLTKSFETFLGSTDNCDHISPLDIVIRRSTICNALRTLFEEITTLLAQYPDDIRFNSAKWNKELERAETLDNSELNMVAMGIASNPHHMLQAQSLSDSEISDLCSLFQDIALQASEEQRQILHSSVDTLKNPRFGNLVDMTDRVRILGDAPMVTGALADFWLAGTSSGNLVAAKVMRGFLARVDEGLAIVREAKISARFAHPNVLPTLGIARMLDSVAVVSPWMRNGNVSEYLSRNPTADRLQLCYEIAQGVKYLHTLGVVHGNLSTASILVSEKGSAVISGFYFAHRAKPECSEGNGDSQPFDWDGIDPPPGYESNICVSKTGDIRSLGALFVRLLSGHRTYWYGLFKDSRESDSPPRIFMEGSSLRSDLWLLLKECARLEESLPVCGQHITARHIVERLAALIAQRPNSPDTNLPNRTWSSPAEQRVALPDLSAEVRKIGDMPITGGGFCDIWMGERLGKEKVALKVLKMFGVPEQIRRRFLAEATIWSHLKHQNILDFYGICDHGASISMVSPWLTNCNVLNYVSNVKPDANRLKLLNEAAEGLLYLHTRSVAIVHGDIKCANILVQDDGTACLADFGLSRVVQEVTSLSLRDSGSQRFMAPELFDAWEDETVPAKTLASDCYAFGQAIVELLSGQKPWFEYPQENLVFMAITRGHRAKRPETEMAKQWMTDPVWALVQRMTATAKDRRPTMHEVAPQLRSFWVLSTSTRPDDIELSSLPVNVAIPSSSKYSDADLIFDHEELLLLE